MATAAFTTKRASPKRSRNRKLRVFGAATGLLYGSAVRLMFTLGDPSWMTGGFTYVLAFAMGFITGFIAEAEGPQSIRTWLLLPWAPLGAGLLAAMLALFTGIIFVVMFVPLGLVFASLGGLVGGIGQCLRLHR